VLRDVTERVIIASKGRFDRAVSRPKRAQAALPHRSTISKDEYMEATLDVWELPSESASRVGHPAPFPVELPQRLIELYTYEGDLVVDPFMGSGSTAVAAVRAGRHYVGFDTDPAYVQAAKARIDAERETLTAGAGPTIHQQRAEPTSAVEAIAAGTQTRDLVALLLAEAGFTGIEAPKRPVHGIDVTLTASGADGRSWCIEVVGGQTTGATGLRSIDAVWRVVGKAALLRLAAPTVGLLVLSPALPARGTRPAKALAAAHDTVAAVLDPLDASTPAALARLATGAT
jgi:site-specific DNA-methyltransferase (adenine-specific)